MSNRTFYSCLLAFLLATIPGCDTMIFERGNGETAMQTVMVESFNEIFLNGNYEVFIEEGDESRVVIKTDENLIDLITIDSRKGTLAISNIKRIMGSDGIKIFITYEDLDRLVCGGASSVFSTSPIVEKTFELTMSGAGLIDLELKLEELEVKLSGAGLIRLQGEVGGQDISMTGAGSLEAFELESKECEISISGVGSAEINVSQKLIAKISGMGGIRYKGSPEDIRREVSGIGKIKEAR